MLVPNQVKINNDYILSFSMSNYLIYGGGTNLVVSNHQKLFNKHGISYVCVAPFLLHGKKYVKFQDYWSLIIDGNYIGVLSTINLIRALDEANKGGASLQSIHIHHWKNANLNAFQSIMNRLESNVYMFIHDYSTICCNFTLLRHGEFCGDGEISEEKCVGCSYYADSFRNRIEYEEIWDKLKKRLMFVFPSDVALKVWTAAYPKYEELCRVIPHQKCIGTYDGNMNNTLNKVRVAFIGSRENYKGWKVFFELYNKNKGNPDFEWIYFGTDDVNIPNIKCVYVDNRQNPMAMLNALRQNSVDVAILWSLCKETYSYTYFECYAANVFVLTNKNSGNIAFQVLKNGNGAVLESTAELFNLFENEIINSVNTFKTGKKKGPKFLTTNDNILECCDSCDINNTIKKNSINNLWINNSPLLYFEIFHMKIRKLRG